jgi:hypothetical protein
MSDFGTISAGSTYLATVNTLYNGTVTDSANIPTITIYDPNRNVIVNAAPMTRTSTGTYGYSYTTSGSATGGVWESVISATVESGKTLPGNDYWNVTTSPPQVIINSVTGTTPTASANVTITNEGMAGYEYQYEWCVVSNINNACGGGDDIFHGTAAKYINPGEDFNTNLSATVPTAGTYYFKLAAFFGTESSRASRSFTITTSGGTTPPSGGSGGSGGGAGIAPTIPPVTEQPVSTGTCNGADLNKDNKVNSVDFSILLSYWKTKPPFRNACADINKDNKVDSVDFSIMLSQWGSKGIPFTKK